MTTTRRRRSSARRPGLPEGAGRRALTNVGGEIATVGDASLCAVLRDALDVRSADRDATLTHPFHAYPARMHPETARRLVAFTATRDKGTVRDHGESPAAGASRVGVYDPFCGSGTVLVEAFAAGVQAAGADLSPLAVELARLKTRNTTDTQRKAIVRRAHQIAERAVLALRDGAQADAPPGEEAWYPPHTLGELSVLRALIRSNDEDARAPIDRDPIVTHALRMLLSSILVKVSYQRSDSDAVRVERHIGPRAATTWFARKSIELARCLEALSLSVPAGCPEPEVLEWDATEPRVQLTGQVACIITSPPYANTYDYVAHHERRYAWLDLDARALRRDELGASRFFRRADAGLARFDEDLTRVCAGFSRALTQNGFVFVLLGDGSVGGAPIFAQACLARAANASGLEIVAAASQVRPAFSREEAQAFRTEPKREHLFCLGRSRPGGPATSPP